MLVSLNPTHQRTTSEVLSRVPAAALCTRAPYAAALCSQAATYACGGVGRLHTVWYHLRPKQVACCSSHGWVASLSAKLVCFTLTPHASHILAVTPQSLSQCPLTPPLKSVSLPLSVPSPSPSPFLSQVTSINPPGYPFYSLSARHSRIILSGTVSSPLPPVPSLLPPLNPHHPPLSPECRRLTALQAPSLLPPLSPSRSLPPSVLLCGPAGESGASVRQTVGASSASAHPSYIAHLQIL